MEEAGILEKITRSGFCYPALNQVPPATRHSPLFQAVSVRSIWGEPGRTANRQAFPSSPYPAISHSLQDRQIERISFRVSTNTHRARFAA